MTTRNYAHLMLFVDELLIKFLEYLHRPRFPTDFADIDAAGLACKAWRDPSLTVKWREVDLKVLLSALAPLRKPLSIWCFAHAPTDSDIYRFHDVTRRVYTLKSFVDMHLGHLILDAISKSLSRSTVLLPNLHSLRLGPDIGAHHSLRTLRLISPYSGSKKSDLEATVAAITTHRLLRHLSLRHPTLKTFWASTLLALASCTMLESLEISIPIDSDIITESSDDAPITDEVVGRLLQHLPHLTELTLRLLDWKSTPLLTFRTLALAIAHCPRLKRAVLVIDATVPIAFTPIPRERRAKRPRILIFSQTVTGMDDVPIDDPEYVAAVLAQLSPEVEIRMENGLKGWPRWDQVARISSKANGVLDTEVIDREE
ncbi:hypothetical protein FRB95_011959 [Tulasnella sp. JGI-2019a]|nr:hypothetical protein FRB95_011959 [Tulasnella sp. JGI-2019a]